jgi:hypothetical protein|tara:strand:+ start:3761 stop:4045 length:285 start_codon:yes stop_codon:yes gene_type:complete
VTQVQEVQEVQEKSTYWWIENFTRDIGELQKEIEALKYEMTRHKTVEEVLIDVTQFYGNPANWKPDESDNILVQYDHGQKARSVLREIRDSDNG